MHILKWSRLSEQIFRVHADGDAVAGKRVSESCTGELRSLIGVEDVRFAVACESVLKGLDTERRLHRDR